MKGTKRIVLERTTNPAAIHTAKEKTPTNKLQI